MLELPPAHPCIFPSGVMAELHPEKQGQAVGVERYLFCCIWLLGNNLGVTFR